MKFRMKCPHCNSLMEAEEEWIGQTTQCPLCSTEIVIQKTELSHEPEHGGTPVSSAPAVSSPPAGLSTAEIVFLYLFMIIPCTGLFTLIACVVLYFCWTASQPEKTRILIRHTLVAALIGIVTTIAISFMLTLTAGLLRSSYDDNGEKARGMACMSNMKQIMLAVKMYSEDHSEKFPDRSGAAGLEMLRRENYLDDPRVYVCLSAGTTPADAGKPLTEDHVSYIYIGGFDENSDPDQGVLFCPHHKDCVKVGLIDGTTISKFGKEYNTVHGILEKEGILKQLDRFSRDTREYIRKKLEE